MTTCVVQWNVSPTLSVLMREKGIYVMSRQGGLLVPPSSMFSLARKMPDPGFNRDENIGTECRRGVCHTDVCVQDDETWSLLEMPFAHPEPEGGAPLP